MTVLPIRHQPDTVLREKAKRVPKVDSSIKRIIDDMIETVHHTPNGVGLAAPQVGISLRIIVLRMPEEEPIVIVNPQIVKRHGERELTEACLSVPGYWGEVKRAVSVTVKGLDREGKAIRIKATDLAAQALEHEIDHLDGTLFLDHVAGELHQVETITPPET
ncbi:MAG: peptide deformylase [Chloroflexota bacterium]